MAKNWKCKIGLHDWEVADGVSVEVGMYEDRWYDLRVCLNCGFIDDQMTPFIESLDEIYQPDFMKKESRYRTHLEKEHPTARKRKAWKILDEK